MPHECCPPAEIVRKVSPPATAVGTGTSESGSPVPVCERVLAPQHRAIPAVVTAQLCPPPAEMALNVWPGAIAVGKLRSLVEESPICAVALPPQHHADWSAARAQVWTAPLAMATQCVSAATACGTLRSAPRPSPSCPTPSAPQQMPVPETSSEQVCAPPAAS